jgi:tRNA-specific 2-thiouridylase
VNAPERVAVAMSGGVDSSAAAAILKEDGYDLVGFSMQLWDQRRGSSLEDGAASRCCSLDDLYDARAVAARLGFPYYVLNFQREFEAAVVRPFIESYRSGYTPSPCVLCNSHLKFDHLVQMAEEVSATHVATGHYARVSRDPATGRYLLRKGLDAAKDQSYFLFGLRQEQLARTIFPLGDRTKAEARAVARRAGLAVAEKAESQEICFVPDGDYAAFVELHEAELCGTQVGAAAGEIVDTSGRVRGRHDGIHHFTVGQRRGLGLSGPNPLYVVAVEPLERRVTVGERAELARRDCRVVEPNWISRSELDAPARARVKIRSRHPEAAATLSPAADGSVRVEFDEPQFAVAPGQAAVFYQEDAVLGGGWIARDGA